MKFYFCLSILLANLLLGAMDAHAANESSTSGSGTKPNYKISIDAQLMSHFIDRGLSMSDKNPALNASFLFNLGQQLSFGFWGSNISNISSADDNFWFKFLAEIKIDFSMDSALRVYLSDDHYYKSNIRNGQIAGLKYNYALYRAQLEWMNNYQGTHTNSEYVNFGRLFNLRQNFKAGALLGYTVQTAIGYDNYFDLKALAIYQISANANMEAGATLITNENQFNGRGAPAFYFSIGLSY